MGSYEKKKKNVRQNYRIIRGFKGFDTFSKEMKNWKKKAKLSQQTGYPDM